MAVPAAQPAGRGGSHRTYVLAVLALVACMNAVDRIVMSMFMEPIKKEFQLTDTQLGLVTGLAFSLLGVVAAVPLARLSDRWNRKWIVGGCLLIWSVMTAACGAVSSFAQLFAARVAVGIGEAGSGPASHSMIGDYYPRELRPRALAIFNVGGYLGLLGGMFGGGVLVQTVGWRAGFLWLGGVGVVLAVIFHFTVREPARVDLPAPPAAAGGALRALFGDLGAFTWLLLAFGMASITSWSVVAWMPSYFARAFSLPPAQIGLGLGLCLGLGTALGTLLGGQIGVRFGTRTPGWAARLAAATGLIGLPMYLGCFHAQSPMLAFALLFGTFVVGGLAVGPLFAMLQDMVAPNARATAVAVLGLAGAVFGQGLGPVVVGMFSDWLQTGRTGAEGLRLALTFVVYISPITSLLFWQVARSMGRQHSPAHWGPG
jgi:MFS transporter, Spinster family, sphingosine-1-phosphate transporter